MVLSSLTAAVLLHAVSGSGSDSNSSESDTSGNQFLTASFYWSMAGAQNMRGVSGGFSWYTKMFSLFQENHALQMQMGMASTWLTPDMSFPVCGCNPSSSWPGGGSTNCCGHSDQCSNVYETFEGGPGYWHGQLPATQVKWRANSATACYDEQSGTPLFPFDQSRPIDCQYLGLAAISNQMVMPPDGFAMDADGMLGVAYVKTPIGKTSASDSRNFWTIVVDSENFAGPLAYWLPEYWQRRQAGWEEKGAHLEDIGTVSTMTGGAGAFEWNTMHTYKDSQGNYKIPKMAFPGKRKDGLSVLYGWGRSYDSSELLGPLEEALSTGVLDTSTIMASGTRMPCQPSSSTASFKLDKSDGSKELPFGRHETRIEDGDCVWTINISTCVDSDTKCAVPQYATSSGKPTTANSVTSALRNQQFPTKAAWGPWDAVNHPPSGGCASSPGPASSTLYCAQTAGSSWLAWRWYKFTEQPAMSRAKLSAAQKSFMQERVETLHKTVGRQSRWIKARGAATEGLATIDRSLIVSPPAGMEHGYVPVAFYEGPSKPANCHAPPPVPSPPPSPPPVPTPTPTPPPSPPPSTSGVWLYQHSGAGKAFVSFSDFRSNYQSSRNGALAWDACGSGGHFDNGVPFWTNGGGNNIGALAVKGSGSVSVASNCAATWNYPSTSMTGPYTEANGKVYHEGIIYLEVTMPVQGVWIAERSGTGKAFLDLSKFNANYNSGRSGTLAWDACGSGKNFDNGKPFWSNGAGSSIGSFAVQGDVTVGVSSNCGLTWSYPSMAVTGAYTEADGWVSANLVYLEAVPALVV